MSTVSAHAAPLSIPVMNVGAIQAEITSKALQTAFVKTNFVCRNVTLAALKELAARRMLLSKSE